MYSFEFITELDFKLMLIVRFRSRLAELDNLGPRTWKAVFLGDLRRVFTSYYIKFSGQKIAVWDVVRSNVSAFFCVKSSVSFIRQFFVSNHISIKPQIIS
jgi:hypothetical protein